MDDLVVSGIDIGSSAFCVATINKHGLTIVLNKESSRETPSMVSFSSECRLTGTEAAGRATTNLKGTVYDITELLGREYNDPYLQSWLPTVPFQVTLAPHATKAAVAINLDGSTLLQYPEQLYAALLTDAKGSAEQSVGSPVSGCVLACPSHYSDAQRQSLLATAHVAGLDVKTLLNSTTAAALTYARFHESDIKSPKLMALVDFGHADMQACVVRLQPGSVKVLAHGWDAQLGGRNFVEALYRHFAAEFEAKHRVQLSSNAKAAHRLRVQCTKLLRVLSANKEAHMRVECLCDDIDLVSTITRDRFEQLVAPLLERVRLPLLQALRGAQVSASTPLDIMEVVGGASRIPCVTAALEELFGGDRTLSRTLNSKEVVAEGCAWHAAQLSGRFRVSVPTIIDCATRTIQATWQGPQGTLESTLFPAGTSLPAEVALIVPVSMDAPLIKLDYVASAADGQEPTPSPGHLLVGPLVPASMTQAPVLRVIFSMSTSGVLQVPGTLYGAPGVALLDLSDVQGKVNGVFSLQDANLKQGGLAVPYALALGGPSQANITAWTQQERQFQEQYRAAEVAGEARNSLESSIYKLRALVAEGGPLSSTGVDSDIQDATKIRKVLEKVEDWLYGEGASQPVSKYQQEEVKLHELQQYVQKRLQVYSKRTSRH